jgi:hypothetical protein
MNRRVSFFLFCVEAAQKEAFSLQRSAISQKTQPESLTRQAQRSQRDCPAHSRERLCCTGIVEPADQMRRRYRFRLTANKK